MFKMKRVIFLPVFIFVFLNSVLNANLGVIGDAYANPGQGQGQGKGKGHGKVNQGHGNKKNKKINSNQKKVNTKNITNSNKVRFVDTDKAVVTKYFSAKPFPTTTLPPGIAKNLLRGKPLPPGIAKVFLPADLVSQLPVYPGYDYLVAGKDVVLVDSTTGIIADILTGVVR